MNPMKPVKHFPEEVQRAERALEDHLATLDIDALTAFPALLSLCCRAAKKAGADCAAMEYAVKSYWALRANEGTKLK